MSISMIMNHHDQGLALNPFGKLLSSPRRSAIAASAPGSPPKPSGMPDNLLSFFSSRDFTKKTFTMTRIKHTTIAILAALMNARFAVTRDQQKVLSKKPNQWQRTRVKLG
eukprot:gnl/MRDRNA2_/MRDRNA2_63658_c0_seq1.p1 gnl/MRDRNA2_/MRDRNA2_63658_c0~~gnl/MRDRNA2_/MRDRNA2_63658_c0_seq1.p1  ORF type:complete len:110 (+),score=13.29 gnl/MRDRNA2_/MRDRNA2_63658_c0_seq1:41-370(+)